MRSDEPQNWTLIATEIWMARESEPNETAFYHEMINQSGRKKKIQNSLVFVLHSYQTGPLE